MENKCHECGGMLFFDKYEVYCRECGMVADEAPINFGREVISTDPEKADAFRRTGPPITWLNPDFGTTFKYWELKKICRSKYK